MPRPRPTIFTIGHSTHPFDELVEMLKTHGVKILVDVRSIPRSWHTPQFNADQLARKLPRLGIKYMPCKELGGRRRAKKDSVNVGWRNASFRGYADYMQTREFRSALKELMQTARREPAAIMCAEAVPWRCHRSLIGDALLVRRWRVLDIMSPTSAREHKLTPFAKVNGTTITYPC